MGEDNSRDTVVLLAQARGGDAHAADELMSRLDLELREAAARYLRRERPNHTLQPTALVNEAWMRMADPTEATYEDRAHVLAVMVIRMRQVLVDHARARGAAKRRGDREARALDSNVAVCTDSVVDTLAVEEALARFAKEHPRPSEVWTLRYFGGRTIDEVAHWLGVGHATVENDSRFAKAWLRRALSSCDDHFSAQKA